jgi:hypothetical protein
MAKEQESKNLKLLQHKEEYGEGKTNKKLAIIALVVVAVVVLYFAYPFIQQTDTKLTLPKGSFVYYTQQGSTSYTLRYGGLQGDQPTLFQVWAGANTAFPESFTFVQGSTYTAFSLQITISEIHSDYIVILVKPLS